MARIRVLVNFGGSPTGFRRILPGEYDEDDPALFGQAAFLLDAGLAELIDGETVIPAEPEPEVAINPDDLAHLDNLETVDLTGMAPEEIEALAEPVDTKPGIEDLTVAQLEALAQEREIDLDSIEGSGAGGRVLKSDLIAAIEAESGLVG